MSLPKNSSTMLRDQIVSILLRHSYARLEADEVGNDTELMEGGLLLDSIGLMSAMTDLESTFQISLDEDEYQDGALDTVGGLVDLIAKKLGPLDR